jgi:hypothetical protein
VPLEWNVLFMYLTAFLFLGYPAQDGYGIGNVGRRLLLIPTVAGLLLCFPVLGNLRPDLVSFLPSMRQYAGNWASGDVGVRPRLRGEARQRAPSSRARAMQKRQLMVKPPLMGEPFDERSAEVVMYHDARRGARCTARVGA